MTLFSDAVRSGYKTESRLTGRTHQVLEGVSVLLLGLGVSVSVGTGAGGTGGADGAGACSGVRANNDLNDSVFEPSLSIDMVSINQGLEHDSFHDLVDQIRNVTVFPDNIKMQMSGTSV